MCSQCRALTWSEPRTIHMGRGGAADRTRQIRRLARRSTTRASSRERTLVPVRALRPILAAAPRGQVLISAQRSVVHGERAGKEASRQVVRGKHDVPPERFDSEACCRGAVDILNHGSGEEGGKEPRGRRHAAGQELCKSILSTRTFRDNVRRLRVPRVQIPVRKGKDERL
ncbi:hypothetical protein L227DRAFT_170600 [Lentinus tigrinus ALCF2SS1-6]|uniref:Uncharacterized protein n=1 Tax=Lentinus tigrinus ALCF2SS1-6 TaxID=1328759 RepID=A0A5C2S5J7_9APHY|nr:hypothetical protein L227DRAFT_170600 [Lentinus tigrinus ALCF2SS1-6]